MANLYFAEGQAADAWQPGALVHVTGEEAHHAVRVSRLRTGEQILVGDGAGTQGAGCVEEVSKDTFSVRLTGVDRQPAPVLRLVLVQALAKGDRAERAVEQSTEFGVDTIVPWQAERSVSRWDTGGTKDHAKRAKGVAKWARIAREASKQSLRSRIPEIGDPVTLESLCEIAASGTVVVLHPRGQATLSAWARDRLTREAGRLHVVVGPEGGLSDHEIDRLEKAGADVLQLGSTVLRTSSAGPAAIAVLNVALGRW